MATETDRDLKHILVIEDSSSDANLVQLMLEADSRYRVEIVDCLAEAARAVERNDPHLILLDLNLPDASGLEAVDAGIKLANAVPLVVLTGSDDETLAIEALKRGAQDYVSKNDANPRLLHRVVRHAEERHRLIRQLQEAQERVELLSRSDPLTGLLNRRGLEQELERESRDAQRIGQTLHVVAWDLDDFKSINDREGHAVGDEILIGVANRARATFRATDAVARIGGDEFMALLRGVRPAEAVVIAERFRESVSAPSDDLDSRETQITISVGLVEVNPRQANIGDLLRMVDVALYSSKAAGKNRVSQSVGDASPPVSAEQICFTAEPMLDPSTENPQAYELLLRSNDTDHDSSTGLLPASRRTLGFGDMQALEQAVNASRFVAGDMPCHINLLPSTLAQEGPTVIGEVLQRGSRTYCIDLSEQQLIGDPTSLLDALKALRAMGHSIGLDHIGSSRSSLETLLALEPDVVKLDVRWTRALGDCPRQRRDLGKLLRILSVSGSTLVVARPSTSEGREILLEIAGSSGIRFLWSDPSRATLVRPEGETACADRSIAGRPS